MDLLHQIHGFGQDPPNSRLMELGKIIYHYHSLHKNNVLFFLSFSLDSTRMRRPARHSHEARSAPSTRSPRCRALGLLHRSRPRSGALRPAHMSWVATGHADIARSVPRRRAPRPFTREMRREERGCDAPNRRREEEDEELTRGTQVTVW
jgi:hypothetical protein